MIFKYSKASFLHVASLTAFFFNPKDMKLKVWSHINISAAVFIKVFFPPLDLGWFCLRLSLWSFAGAGLAYSHRETTSRQRAQTSKGHGGHRGVTTDSSVCRVHAVCWRRTKTPRSCMTQELCENRMSRNMFITRTGTTWTIRFPPFKACWCKN